MLNILVIAAHPDDEILGCGGTIAKNISNGNQVHILIMAEGITGRDDVRDPSIRKKELDTLKEVAINANKIIGTTSLTFLDFISLEISSLLISPTNFLLAK